MVTANRLPSGLRQSGFAFIEILMGLLVLGLAFACLSAYTVYQRKGLINSNRLSDASHVAASALETLKGQLADSAAFKQMYDNAAGREVKQSSRKTVNKSDYTIDLAIARAPVPLYALKARANVTWGKTHAVMLGLLVPGASDNL